MSVRTYCDNCGEELLKESDNAAKHAIESGKGGVTYRILAGFNSLYEGEVCAKCVLKAIRIRTPEAK
jgi:hypothetical protein